MRCPLKSPMERSLASVGGMAVGIVGDGDDAVESNDEGEGEDGGGWERDELGRPVSFSPPYDDVTCDCSRTLLSPFLGDQQDHSSPRILSCTVFLSLDSTQKHKSANKKLVLVARQSAGHAPGYRRIPRSDLPKITAHLLLSAHLLAITIGFPLSDEPP